MHAYLQIIQEVPLFRGFTLEELSRLVDKSEYIDIKANEKISLTKNNSMYIIVDGLLIVEGGISDDPLFLGKGSYFGAFPFLQLRRRGNLRGITYTRMLAIDVNVFVRFLLENYRCLRAYLRSAQKYGYQLIEEGAPLIENKARIITTIGHRAKIGKSLVSAAVAAGVSEKSKCLVIDVARDGNSIFDFFQQKITSPFSQRLASSGKITGMEDYIVEVTENLHLLNLNFGNKIEIDPEIISPLIFVLAQQYNFIIFDTGSIDSLLNQRIISISDIVLQVVADKQENVLLQHKLDNCINEGQRVITIYNRRYYKGDYSVYGGFSVEKISGRIDYTEDSLFYKKLIPAELINLITTKRRALILDSELNESLLFTSILVELMNTDSSFDRIYSSAFGSILSLFILKSEGSADLQKNIGKFFPEIKFNNLLEPLFPEKYSLEHKKFFRLFKDVFGNDRLEYFKYLPILKLRDINGKSLMRTTGNVADLATASVAFQPLFNPVKSGNELLVSAFPFNRPNCEDLLRTDTDYFVQLSVAENSGITVKSDKYLGVYQNFINYCSMDDRKKYFSPAADQRQEIAMNISEISADTIMRLTSENSRELFGNIIKKIEEDDAK